MGAVAAGLPPRSHSRGEQIVAAAGIDALRIGVEGQERQAAREALLDLDRPGVIVGAGAVGPEGDVAVVRIGTVDLRVAVEGAELGRVGQAAGCWPSRRRPS